MKITSTAFTHGGDLPDRFAREDDNLSPPVLFSDVPPEARSLALIMDDPDAPSGTFTHWVVFNLPPNTGVIPEDAVPATAVEGKNSTGGTGYSGPRPPSGTHRYFFHAFALDGMLDVRAGADRNEVERAMEGRVVGNATLMGRYSAPVAKAH